MRVCVEVPLSVPPMRVMQFLRAKGATACGSNLRRTYIVVYTGHALHSRETKNKVQNIFQSLKGPTTLSKRG